MRVGARSVAGGGGIVIHEVGPGVWLGGGAL